MSSLPYPAVSRAVDAIVFQPLWLPGEKPIFLPFVIAGGQTLQRGSVLGQITASGKLTLALAASSDGSQVPMAILTEDLATVASDGSTALDMSVSVAVRGMFNPAALVFGTGLTWANSKAALASVGIYGRYLGYSG